MCSSDLYFESLQDPNAMLKDAQGGNELWPPSRFYNRQGQPNVLSLQGNIGRDGKRNIGAADVDMYRVEIMSPGLLTANADAANNGDAYVRLFNEQGSVLAQDNDRLNSVSLESGTYYIGNFWTRQRELQPSQRHESNQCILDRELRINIGTWLG